jgi:hypothetical protein
VVQLVGHLTVNEDGEGSNPSAPASFYDSQDPDLSYRALSRREYGGRSTLATSESTNSLGLRISGVFSLPRVNEVADFLRFKRKLMHVLFEFAIRHGKAVVLALMFRPRIHNKRLHIPVGSF